MIDILITTYNRKEFLKQTVESVFEKTKNMDYRLFIIDDCSTDGTQDYLRNLQHTNLVCVHFSKVRNGIVPSFNILWNQVRFFDRFFEQKEYLCYLQDDCVILRDGWLWILLSAYEKLKEKCDIGFFSAYDAPEHPVRQKVKLNGEEILLKDSQTATNLIASKDFWRSINDDDGEVPRNNPDGSARGFPGNGKGSQIDLYWTGCKSGSEFIHGAAAPNCSFRQKKRIMIISMIEHLGHSHKESTWRGSR